MRVLITDGENRSSLAALRSLGRRQHQLFVTGSHASCICSSSKFCYQYIKIPDPLRDGPGFISHLAQIISEFGIDVVLPMTEQSILRMNDDRSQFEESCIIACATPPQMKQVSVV